VRSFVRLLGFLRPHLRGSLWSLGLSILAIAGTVAIAVIACIVAGYLMLGTRD